MIKKILFLIGFLSLSLAGFCQQDLSGFAPLDSQLKDTKILKLADYDVTANLYSCQQEIPLVKAYYADFFAKNGFTKVLENSSQQRDLTRYKKGQEMITVAIGPGKDVAGTQVVISGYIKPKNKSDLEKQKLTWAGLMGLMDIKEEEQGKDSGFIPRAQNSIRIKSLTMMGTEIYLYVSQLPIEQIYGFYQRLLESSGITQVQEADLNEVINTIQKSSGFDPKQFNLFADAKVTNFTKDSKYISLTDPDKGSAQILIMNNPQVDGEFKSIIFIRITQGKK